MVEESEYLNWLISGCNIVDFKRLLDSFGSLDKKQIDNFAQYLDKNENGFIEYEHFQLAISNFNEYDPHKKMQILTKKDSEELPEVDFEVELQNLGAILYKKNIQADQIWKKYDANRSYLLSTNEIAAVFKDHAGIKVKGARFKALDNYIRSKYGRQEIKKKEWNELISYPVFEEAKSVPSPKNALNKDIDIEEINDVPPIDFEEALKRLG